MTEGKTYRVVRDGVVRWVVVDLVDGDHSDATVLARVVDAQGGWCGLSGRHGMLWSGRWGMAERAVCPACWHAETRRGRLNGYEPTRDDTQLMSWHVTPMSGGVWHCETCGVTLPPAAAGVLLDAALMASDPDSDSIGDDGVHADVHIALRGGYDD